MLLQNRTLQTSHTTVLLEKLIVCQLTNKCPVFGGFQICIVSLEPDKSSHTIRSYFCNCIRRLSSSLYQDVPNGPSHFCESVDISSLTVCYLASYGVYSEDAHFESSLEQESPWNFLFSSVHAGKCKDSSPDSFNLRCIDQLRNARH